MRQNSRDAETQAAAYQVGNDRQTWYSGVASASAGSHKTLGTGLTAEGFSYAMLADAKDNVKLRRVGQGLGGAEIKSISEGSIEVLFAGEVRTLTIQKPKSRR